ncbi:MAG: Ig-like domain-containing protein [Candidatus Micrarchaeota archaeon]|nr:Ig-like domain-containing protein [Candidatus Micrarchaeota archaeon]
MAEMRIQSATEYILTYGWAFLIAAVVVASLYLFVFAPSTIAQSSCTFFSGPYCQGIVLGSSNTLSKVALLLTNTQPYPILDPALVINMSGLAPISASCSPNVVLAGGAIICSATITPAISQGTLASGTFIFTYTPCAGGNAAQCHGAQRQNFAGNFDTHASQLLSPTTISIALVAQNSSQVALSTSFDKLTATVKMLGTPLSGATVNFTSNSISAVVNPLVTTTDGSGNAVSYISSSASVNALVTATFANAMANTIISFTPAICYTLSAAGVSGASGNILTVDGVGYSSVPQQLCYGQGTSHTYSFQSTVSGAAGVQYIFNSASGCGQSSQSGTISSNTNCTLSGNYITQYFLTTSASPGAGGSVTPSSGWYNAGNSATLGETPNAGYAFNGFTGTGSGSYTGSNTAPAITLNNPITETGSFTSTSSTTTSTTSTSSTTTIPSCTNNWTGGQCTGSTTYTANTALSSSANVSVDVIVNSGVVLDEHGNYYVVGNMLKNSGIITDTYSGGAGLGGTGGSCGGATSGSGPGGAGLSRNSLYSSNILVAGTGGGGGGRGGANLNCWYGGSGGSGGNGGGIVELYMKYLDNLGLISANGIVGGDGASLSGGPGCYCGGAGGGGAGGGGSGGTVFIGRTNVINAGAIFASGATGGTGGNGGTSQGGSGGGAGSPPASGGYGGSGGSGGSYPGSPGGGGGGGGTGGASGIGINALNGNVVQFSWP